jgi:hypothetical protein
MSEWVGRKEEREGESIQTEELIRNKREIEERKSTNKKKKN